MATDVVMPVFRPDMEVGKIIEWKKKDKAKVLKGEVIVIIEAEKVSYEVESLATGILHILVEEGTEGIAVGEIIGVIAVDKAEYKKICRT
jgi:pyruvate dehydrogenase E2 component (dihydrolipoamide acetyltransferase)